MDKIFREIKKAIEEEMRNAESGPPPGGGRTQGGGRRAQEYADWLKEEQDRLRGSGRAPEAQPRPVPIEDVQMEVPAPPQRVERDRPAQPQESRTPRSGQGETQRPRPQRRSNPQNRANARNQRRSDAAYDQRGSGGAATRRRIQSILRTNQGIKQAFLLREIVSKPVSLRDKDDHLIS
jgi:hypothetical protein